LVGNSSFQAERELEETIRLSIGPEHLARSVEIIGSVGTLPAVATQDWPERAARTLLPIRRIALACVTIAEVGPSGEILTLEATGGVRGDAQGSPIQADRLHPPDASSFGWWIADASGGRSQATAALLRELSHSDKWPETYAGRRWAKFGVSDLLVGMIPLKATEPSRVVVVEMGVPSEVRPFDPGDAEILVAVLPELAKRTRLAFGSDISAPGSRLTPREQQILEQLSLGRTVKQIAAELSRSPHTIHDHVKSLHHKLGASTRGELIARFFGHIDACTIKSDRPEAAPSVMTRRNDGTQMLASA
jgi:DNA-binding CsgD family transcriptional regulator